MKKLLTLFSALSIFPLLGQLTISCESSERNELLQILSSIKPLDIIDINEDELKTWCIDWIKYIKKENQPQRLDNRKLKDVILLNLAIYAVSHFVEVEAEVKTVIKQLSKNNPTSIDPVLSALEEISEEKIIKALIFIFLIASINDKDSAFECEFEPLQNEQDKRFVLTVKKANWEDIEEKSEQAFIDAKKTIVETSATKLLRDYNLPAGLAGKTKKVQTLIKNLRFSDVKNVYDTIVNEKTFTIDFSN